MIVLGYNGRTDTGTLELFTNDVDWVIEGLACIGGPEAILPEECV